MDVMRGFSHHEEGGEEEAEEEAKAYHGSDSANVNGIESIEDVVGMEVEEPSHNTTTNIIIPPVPPPTTTTTSSTKNNKNNKKKSSSKAHITSKEYEEMTQLLLLQLKHWEEEHHNNNNNNNEEEEEEGGGIGRGGDEYKGCKWKDLTAWYVQRFVVTQQQEIPGSEGYEEKKKLVNQVIRRMIKHEGQIMVMNSASSSGNTGQEEEKVNEEKILKLHPSCQI